MVGAAEVGWCRVACTRPESEPVGPTLVSTLEGEAAPPVRYGRETCSRPTTSPAFATGWTACAETSEGGDTFVDLDCGDKVRVGRAVVRVTSPVPAQAKPKTPIGRRGASLIIVCGLPARGASLAGPASLPREGQGSCNPRPQGRPGKFGTSGNWSSRLLPSAPSTAFGGRPPRYAGEDTLQSTATSRRLPPRPLAAAADPAPAGIAWPPPAGWPYQAALRAGATRSTGIRLELRAYTRLPASPAATRSYR